MTILLLLLFTFQMIAWLFQVDIALQVNVLSSCVIFFTQTLMNVRLNPLVTQMLSAPTHLDPSHVHATKDTVEME